MNSYPIVEMFHSVQGEGLWTGSNAYFVRLAGCDVGCEWCDTKQSWDAEKHRLLTVDEIVSSVPDSVAFVVITGGEPLLHDLKPLTDALEDFRTHLETSGTQPLTGYFDWITLSPKPHKLPVLKHCDELKIVVQSSEDLIFAELMRDRIASNYLFLQPEAGTKKSRQLILDYISLNPQWRLSLQTHKLLGIR